MPVPADAPHRPGGPAAARPPVAGEMTTPGLKAVRMMTETDDTGRPPEGRTHPDTMTVARGSGTKTLKTTGAGMKNARNATSARTPPEAQRGAGENDPASSSPTTAARPGEAGVPDHRHAGAPREGVPGEAPEEPPTADRPQMAGGTALGDGPPDGAVAHGETDVMTQRAPDGEDHHRHLLESGHWKVPPVPTLWNTPTCPSCLNKPCMYQYTHQHQTPGVCSQHQV